MKNLKIAGYEYLRNIINSSGMSIKNYGIIINISKRGE